jgi:hypothetical protein
MNLEFPDKHEIKESKKEKEFQERLERFKTSPDFQKGV